MHDTWRIGVLTVAFLASISGCVEMPPSPGAPRTTSPGVTTSLAIGSAEGRLRLLGQKFFRDKWICLSG